MLNRVAITCAVTGAGDTVDKHPAIPVTPAQIAESGIEAAKAGAAILHIHVRDPETGRGGRDPAMFREVVRLIRASGVDVILNLTGGMGGMLVLPEEDPQIQGPTSDLVSAAERFRHIVELRPEICTIDCGSMNFGLNNVVVNRPSDLTRMATMAMELGVKPELECFDMGQVGHALDLMKQGLIPDPPMFQFVLGVSGGSPADAGSILAMRNMLPANAWWAAFGISRHSFPMVAQAALLGGHVRVGLEDNLYLGRGVHASNAQLVERAVHVLDAINVQPMSAAETREKLGLMSYADARQVA